MSANYFEDAQMIIGRLEDLRYQKWSSTLVADVRAGATGGEIYMAVRFHLKEMLQQEKDLPVDVISMSRALIKNLSQDVKLPE